jgi:hypothetical protein
MLRVGTAQCSNARLAADYIGSLAYSFPGDSRVWAARKLSVHAKDVQ